jgi:hypothetical protein
MMRHIATTAAPSTLAPARSRGARDLVGRRYILDDVFNLTVGIEARVLS